jgi:coenzyme F420-reducing hydrogenase gamma subunit
LHLMCCRTCRQSIGDLYTSVDEYLQAMEAMK